MAPQDRISRLAQQIGDRLQNASQAPEAIQKGVFFSWIWHKFGYQVGETVVH